MLRSSSPAGRSRRGDGGPPDNMSREAHIPLALWVSAAIVAHLAGGGGAAEVATFVEGQKELRRLVEDTHEGVRDLVGGETMEVALVELPPTPPPELPPSAGDTPDGESDEEGDTDADAEAAEQDEEPVAPDPEKQPEPKPEQPDPQEEEPEPEETPAPETPPDPATQKAEEKKAEEKKKQEEKKLIMLPDRRIAIKQHVAPDQAPNPDAKRIADQANNTLDETVARIRAYDGDAKDPTAGTHAGPREAIGDSEVTELGFVEEKAGDPMHAPGENAPESVSAKHSAPEPEHAPTVARSSAPEGNAGLPGTPGEARSVAAVPEAPLPSLGGSGPASPEVATAADGSYSLDPANPGGDGRTEQPGRRRPRTAMPSPIDVRSLGLGGSGLPGVANLTQRGVEQAVGEEQLRAERMADGASRRKRHRGSSHMTSFDRMRAAVENYEPSVKLGNQTNLNAAAVPFAGYLNSIHNRLHPIFADEFLRSLDNLPLTDAQNQRKLTTHLEIVLSAADGRLVRMGVTKQSGVMAFDISAMQSVQRASPFGQAPDIIASPDGNVYLHWEFHRDPFHACSTRNARPFKLKNPPKIGVPPKSRKPGLPGQTPRDERGRSPGPLLPLRKP